MNDSVNSSSGDLERSFKNKINSIRLYTDEQTPIDAMKLPRKSSFTDKLKIAQTDASFYKCSELSPIKKPT